MNKVLLVLGFLVMHQAFASPEIKGAPEEIEQYLTGIPKVVSLTGLAEKKIHSDEARIKLLVVTSSKNLADALKQNYTIRTKTKETLLKLGISKDSVSESKFSSTPEYGLFGDLPKSYRVSNILSIVVKSEEQFISVVNIADIHDKIRYLSAKPIITGEKSIRKALVEKALDEAKQKALIYETQLGVSLVPVFFEEVSANITAYEKTAYRAPLKSVSSALTKLKRSMGENKLTVSIRVKYNVLPQQ